MSLISSRMPAWVNCFDSPKQKSPNLIAKVGAFYYLRGNNLLIGFLVFTVLFVFLIISNREHYSAHKKNDARSYCEVHFSSSFVLGFSEHGASIIPRSQVHTENIIGQIKSLNHLSLTSTLIKAARNTAIAIFLMSSCTDLKLSLIGTLQIKKGERRP